MVLCVAPRKLARLVMAPKCSSEFAYFGFWAPPVGRPDHPHPQCLNTALGARCFAL